MSTIIYPSPIFGPVRSRRLGISLGINLMPKDGKVCNFDCIYCECGFNKDYPPFSHRPSREEVAEALQKQLQTMCQEGELPDVLTFAGNGEPTLHPDFPEIINDTIFLRNQYCPQAKVAVLSNATRVPNESIRQALMLVDDNIQKLDTIDEAYIRMVNRPTSHYNVNEIIEGLKSFKGHVIIQTMFLHGYINGKDVSNIDASFVNPWLDALLEIAPKQVMIYTIDRETPHQDLQKAQPEELEGIAELLRGKGLKVSVSY